ncbi:MAG: FtsX-like permease family protein [Zoogloeaceae bacterium]|jgi:putative ABC transport system permease protein|nr:FtsX-like permease family protein [Zoogloeaceae bacterium]
MNFFLLAWKNILRNRRRSVITILIAALGCASILLAGGFALYSYETLADSAAREYGHLTIAHKDFFTRDEETPMQFGMQTSSAIMQKLRADARVRHILPRVSFSGLISNDDKSVIFIGIGAQLGDEVEVRGNFLKILEGSVGEARADAPRVLLGVDLARSLGARPGSVLTLLGTTTSGSINAIDVVLSGIVSTGWSEADKRLAFVDLEAAQRLLVTDKVSSYSVYLADQAQIPALRAELEAMGTELTFRPWQQQAFYYASVKGLYNRIFGILGIIIALLVLFSVSNTLAMSVVERTREIGALRALGTQPEEIVAQFVREGALIGAAGVFIGNVVAGLLTFILPSLGFEMPPPPGSSTGYPLLVSASLPMYLIVDVTIIALCALAAWYASRNAARKPIMEALRYV